jgi:endonuclease III
MINWAIARSFAAEPRLKHDAALFRLQAGAMTRLDFREVIEALSGLYPPDEPLTDPFEIIVWENVGYLIDDERRAGLFSELNQRIGLTAASLSAAPHDALLDIVRRGGMHPDKRAQRLQDIARLVLEECGGDLREGLAALPTAKARALLKRFPSIADPGADRILLFAGLAAAPALESNGLRAMVRMGFCLERPSYGVTYRDAVAVLARQGEPGREWLMRAYQLLREHGRTLCKRNRPECLACPLDAACAHAVVSAL